ncbi:MAG: glutamine--tRNA ligase/YqeY domain fusion protein [Hydrogenophilus sp.]|nr:glutamine--tRNA ligase/YqeY domain fusion protein [Hydrogenophilus sp.]
MSTPLLPSNFIRNAIDEDLAAGRYSHVVTRFPPEPNGYLHFGHAKSILLNFGLAKAYGGRCHLRFDDTNPETESEEYARAIEEAVAWLGCDWGDHCYYASDFFETMYRCAVALIERGLAYVDSQTAEEIRARRGTLTEPGENSPYRDRSIAENLDLFARMRAGEFPDGAHVLRAKIDMAHPNINLRDPVIYRIRHLAHYRQGTRWCIYPTYTFAHPIEDAIEGVTHSICTLEFEDQRPFYEWLLEALADAGIFQRPLPRQIEFARLNLTYTVLSKRKLIELVERGLVSGWDDPRMPTLIGGRRRGYCPEGFRIFADRIGVAKADSWIDYEVFEEAQRDALNEIAVRRLAVLDPLELILTNFPADQIEWCAVPNHPQKPEWGTRNLPFTHRLFIERDDYHPNPPPGYKRLSPGGEVRLRYAYIIRCTGHEQDASGRITRVYAEYLPDSKSGTAGADRYKPKGAIHWLSAEHAVEAELRAYDRLFIFPIPGAADESGKERHFLDDFNPNSLVISRIFIEPELAAAPPETRVQLERHGYFITDRYDHAPGRPVLNRTVSLKASWSAKETP